MKYEITLYGNPVLRQKAKSIKVFDDKLKQIVQNMIQTMHAASGVGLAAQQIGKTIAVCVVEIPEEWDEDKQGQRLNPDVKMPLVLINPEILERSKQKGSREEGCLSFPGINVKIVRPMEIKVRYCTLNGTFKELHVTDLLARAIQHEIDHLNGILFIDRMSPVKKAAISGKLKRLRAQH